MSDEFAAALKRTLYWSAVLAANLAVPLPLGLLVTGEQGGRVGMWLGVWTLWAVGAVVCCRSERVLDAVLPGGVLVALSQLFPVAQLLAGVGAFAVWHAVAGPGLPATPFLKEARGFSAVLVTGQLLIATALVVGVGLRSAASRPARSGETRGPSPAR